MGALVVVLVLVTGFFLRQKGFLTTDRSRIVSSSELSDLSARVNKIDERVSAINQRFASVEQDVEHLPTREELHALEMQQAVMQEHMAGLENTTTATNHAVGRVENFLIELSKGRNQ
ncbi:MAG: hypothetical protein CSA70_03605 [Rhodobacterales bacterium]|nr:MAG: hypothetical protein CSA70_03605 [Rhodobacterales bacterium]